MLGGLAQRAEKFCEEAGQIIYVSFVMFVMRQCEFSSDSCEKPSIEGIWTRCRAIGLAPSHWKDQKAVLVFLPKVEISTTVSNDYRGLWFVLLGQPFYTTGSWVHAEAYNGQQGLQGTKGPACSSLRISCFKPA